MLKHKRENDFIHNNNYYFNSFFPASIDIGLGLLLIRVLMANLGSEKNPYEEIITSFCVLNQNYKEHAFIKMPQCNVCGNGIIEKKAIQILNKKTRVDKGGREINSGDLLPKINKFISSFNGIITDVFKTDIGQNNLFYMYNATHPFVYSSSNIDFFLYNSLVKSGGVGLNEEDALVSVICEALERYSGVDNDFRLAEKFSYSEIFQQAVHPNELFLFSEQQFLNSEIWNLTADIHNRVYFKFPEENVFDWTTVWSLSQEKFKYLPTQFCYYRSKLPDWNYFPSDSNGCAMGSSINEAILSGLYELFERDSAAIWWYNKIKRPGVDINSYNNSVVGNAIKYLNQHNRDLWALDITNDLNVPVFVALSSRKDRESIGMPQDIIFGFGCHLNSEIALSKAVLELLQGVPCVYSTKENGNTDYKKINNESLKWWLNATKENQPYILPDENTPLRKNSDFVNSNYSIYDSLQYCLNQVHNLGLEVLVVDQTLPEINIPVAKVIVPGLRHFWRRLGAGRLYDVPVKLGWLKNSKREKDMNEYSIFI